MSVTVLSARDLRPRDVGRALRERGGLLLHPSVDDDLCAKVVKAAHDFFQLPASVKAAMAIERSPHFRGWSEMHNERDWREQIHFGRERHAPQGAPFTRLEGPNQWPADESWRATITAYLDRVATVGERLLGCAAADLGLPADSFAGVGQDGYVLLKLIGYHPQQTAEAQRSGVAAHVDFSWLTLTLQDAPGLEIQDANGDWIEVDVVPGSLWVHAGELLQVASGGAYPATPHRVINRSFDRTRVSLPLFLNPPLSGWVKALVSGAGGVPADGGREPAHVHRVLAPGVAVEPFHFGEAEWRRKGRNGWCHACAPPRAA